MPDTTTTWGYTPAPDAEAEEARLAYRLGVLPPEYDLHTEVWLANETEAAAVYDGPDREAKAWAFLEGVQHATGQQWLAYRLDTIVITPHGDTVTLPGHSTAGGAA